MDGYVLDRIYRQIEQDDKSDKNIEIFWYGFKHSIINYFNSINEKCSIDLNKISSILNEYQNECRYRDIAKIIKKHIEWYASILINKNAVHKLKQ